MATTTLPFTYRASRKQEEESPVKFIAQSLCVPSIHRPNPSALLKHPSFYQKWIRPNTEHRQKCTTFSIVLRTDADVLRESMVSLQNLTELPPIDDLVFVMHKCTQEKERSFAMHMCTIICKYGLELYEDIGNYLVTMFVDCGGIKDAHRIFQKFSHCTEHSWDLLIHGFVECGEADISYDLFENMQKLSVVPSKYTFVTLLKACSELGHVRGGWKLHAEIVQHSHEDDIFIGTALVDLYGKCGWLIEACDTFYSFEQRDVVLWTALIGGFAEQGVGEEALIHLEMMRAEGVLPNAVTYLCSLKACSSIGALRKGQQLHAEIVKEGFDQIVSVANILITMYCECGLFEEAQDVFEEIEAKDIISWNSLIDGFADHGFGEEALNILQYLRKKDLSANPVTFSSSLKACASIRAIDVGQDLHADIACEGYEDDTLVANSLVAMYAKCGCFPEAHDVFEVLEIQHSIAWSALIAGYADHGLVMETIALYEQMQEKEIPPSALTFASVLKACSTEAAIDLGQHIHNEIIKEEFETNLFISNALVDFYAKCGLLLESKELFDEMSVRDVVSWNALIGGFVENDLLEEATKCFYQMQEQEDAISPNVTTYLCLVKACSSVECLERGQELHHEVAKEGFEKEFQITCSLVDLYAKCALFAEAHELLDGPSGENVFAWNALISGYSKHGLDEKVFDCLEEMQQRHICPDGVSFVFALKACNNLFSLESGHSFHSLIVTLGLEGNSFVANTLLDMYVKCNSMVEAQQMFDELPIRDVVSWTSVMSGYANEGHGEAALNCLEQMKREGTSPNDVTYICSLRACSSGETYVEYAGAPAGHRFIGNSDDASVKNLNVGLEIHCMLMQEGFESIISVGNALICMYANLGLIREAEKVFINLTARDTVSWNILIGAYAEHMQCTKALDCLEQIEREGLSPNEVTFVVTLQACGSIRAINKGRQIHCKAIKVGQGNDSFVLSSLINMYGKCGFLLDVRDVFDKMPVRDTVSWTALIGGFVEQGFNEEAWEFWAQMQREGILPAYITILCLLKACRNMKAEDKGHELHSLIVKRGILESNVDDHTVYGRADADKYAPKAWRLQSIKVSLWNSLIDMYGKCGSMSGALYLFNEMPRRDIISWNSIITAFAQKGESSQVFNLLDRMKKEGEKPDVTIFLNVLKICSHAGLVADGKAYFEAMSAIYGVTPAIEHYNCMLDLLGRAGYLHEAITMVDKMPFLPDLVTWFSVLTACCKWGNVQLGQHAFDAILKFDPENLNAFSLMYRIYLNAGRLNDAESISMMMTKSKPSSLQERVLLGSHS